MADYIHHHRVRYADTDRMGIVYHGRYFEWMEAARTEMLRSGGLAYKAIEESGIILPVLECNCRYTHAFHYDDLVAIETVLASIDRVKLKLEYILRLEGSERIHARGYTLHCYLSENGRAVRASKELIDRLKSV